MKKLIILTALISAISVFSYADSLEKIEYKSEYGTGNINNSKREYSQFMNELSGKINLDDEWKGLELNFSATIREFLDENKNYGGNALATDFDFTKTHTLGNKDIKFILVMKYANSDDQDVVYLDGLTPLKQINGHGYQAYLGTSIPFTILGQDLKVTPRLVYYNDQGHFTIDYKDQGTAGIGGDFDISLSGPIASGKYGKIKYNLLLNNHWRDATDTKDTQSDGEDTVYLNYIAMLTYTSPKYYGFGFDLNIFNQWERFTADSQRNNGFYVAPKVSYTHTFDTSIGKVTVNPYISYNIIDDQTRHVNYLNKKFDYSGNNELTGGIGFSFDAE